MGLAYKRVRRPEKDTAPFVIACGELLQFHAGKAYNPPPAQTRRSVISQFSDAARLRLTKRLCTIDFKKTKVSVCITLTYPDAQLPRRKEARKQDLKLMIRHIEKHLGKKVYGIWRTEWVPRKSGKHQGELEPHIHLILFGVVFIAWQKIRHWWMNIIRWDDYVRTEIKRAGSKKRTCIYLAKYIKKKGIDSLVYPSYWDNVDGKHYGWVRPELIPVAKCEWIDLPTDEVLDYLFDVLHLTFPKSETKKGESFTILGRSVANAIRFAQKLQLTPTAK